MDFSGYGKCFCTDKCYKMFIITLSDFMNVIVYVMTFYWKIEKLLYDQEFNPKWSCVLLCECLVLHHICQNYSKKFMLKSYLCIPNILSNDTSRLFRTQSWCFLVELNSLRYLDKEKLKVFPTFKSSCINELNSLISLVTGEFPKANRDS